MIFGRHRDRVKGKGKKMIDDRVIDFYDLWEAQTQRPRGD